MIQIKKITPQTVDLYSPDGIHLGALNEYEFLAARVEIKERQERGYYCIFNDRKIRLDENGTLEEYPIGMFDTLTNFYMELIRI